MTHHRRFSFRRRCVLWGSLFARGNVIQGHGPRPLQKFPLKQGAGQGNRLTGRFVEVAGVEHRILITDIEH